MNAGMSFSTKKPISAHVRFETRPVEDVAASKEAGRYIAKDVEYVIITAPYSEGKENIHRKVSDWMPYLEQEVRAGRMPVEWVDRYKLQYQKWKEGQELPPDGTPIKGWGMISPAQQEMLVHIGILTVEELAQVNDTGMRAMGMGGQDLKNKAMAWLTQLQDKGPLTQEMAALKRENTVQAGQIETLLRQVEELKRLIPAAGPSAPIHVPVRASIAVRDAITVNDIFPTLSAPAPSETPSPEVLQEIL